jgi:hypothetical protein
MIACFWGKIISDVRSDPYLPIYKYLLMTILITDWKRFRQGLLELFLFVRYEQR